MQVTKIQWSSHVIILRLKELFGTLNIREQQAFAIFLLQQNTQDTWQVKTAMQIIPFINQFAH